MRSFTYTAPASVAEAVDAIAAAARVPGSWPAAPPCMT